MIPINNWPFPWLLDGRIWQYLYLNSLFLDIPLLHILNVSLDSVSEPLYLPVPHRYWLPHQIFTYGRLIFLTLVTGSSTPPAILRQGPIILAFLPTPGPLAAKYCPPPFWAAALIEAHTSPIFLAVTLLSFRQPGPGSITYSVGPNLLANSHQGQSVVRTNTIWSTRICRVSPGRSPRWRPPQMMSTDERGRL